MKKLLLFAGIILSFCAALPAGDRPIFDFYAGYSYQRFDATSGTFTEGMPWGLGLSACGYPHKNVGVLLDFSYSRKTFENDSEKFTTYHFLVGPQFTARYDRIEPFVRGFVGWAHNRGADLEGSMALTKFCYGFGGGIDIKCNDLVSIRVIQFDFIRQTDVIEANIYRFGVGVVFHGRR